jgi:PAS domain S-box-containing protein
MARQDFVGWASRFPDALLLVSREGAVKECNSAFLQFLGPSAVPIEVRTIFEWSVSSKDSVEKALRLWAGSGQLIYGNVVFELPGAGRVRCEGAVLSGAEHGIASDLIIRVRKQATASEKFLGLNRKVEELNNEVKARVRSEKEAREQRERYQVTLASIGDAVIATDVNGDVEFMNGIAEALTGWELVQARGLPIPTIFEIFNEQTRVRVENPMRQVFSKEVMVGLANHTVLRAKNGTERPIEHSAAPIRSSEGDLIGAVLVFRDVTDERRAREELERALNEAVAASQAKDDFLATLSHELRNPLNPILLIASENKNDPAISPAIQNDFAMIAKNASVEARLIDDLLDLTSIVRGKLTLELKNTDISQILNEAVALVRPQLTAKQISLEMDRQPTGVILLADPVRLGQVFSNLLKNAVKFTPDGGAIGVELNKDEGANRLTIRFWDSGIGMNESELERIFLPFAQGDHSKQQGGQRFGGLGLGLAISIRLVERHGGHIRARSEGRGKGSIFDVVLPIPTAPIMTGSSASETTITPPRVPPKTYSVLIVEDDENTRVVLERLLRARKYKVSAAHSKASAIALAATNNFDVLISDIGLPDGSGYELMCELSKKQEIVGIALTGYGMNEDRERARHAGFATQMTKPIAIDKLERVLLDTLAIR